MASLAYGGAVGQIVHGDKKDPAKTADTNDGHAIDVAELGGDAATGRDVCLCATRSRRHRLHLADGRCLLQQKLKYW